MSITYQLLLTGIELPAQMRFETTKVVTNIIGGSVFLLLG
jgi:hypothetical protein